MRPTVGYYGCGPIILMLQRSRTFSTLTRRSFSLELSSVRFSMVRVGHPPPHLSTRAHSVRSVILGIIVTLFFQCMAALFKPIHLRGDGVRWGLVLYTVAMFSFVTMFTAMNLILQSDSYIDKREFWSAQGSGPGPYPYGPLEYQSNVSCPMAFGVIPGLMFLFNYWLADGLLVSSSFCVVFTHSDV